MHAKHDTEDDSAEAAEETEPISRSEPVRTGGRLAALRQKEAAGAPAPVLSSAAVAAPAPKPMPAPAQAKPKLSKEEQTKKMVTDLVKAKLLLTTQLSDPSLHNILISLFAVPHCVPARPPRAPSWRPSWNRATLSIRSYPRPQQQTLCARFPCCLPTTLWLSFVGQERRNSMVLPRL